MQGDLEGVSEAAMPKNMASVWAMESFQEELASHNTAAALSQLGDRKASSQ